MKRKGDELYDAIYKAAEIARLGKNLPMASILYGVAGFYVAGEEMEIAGIVAAMCEREIKKYRAEDPWIPPSL